MKTRYSWSAVPVKERAVAGRVPAGGEKHVVGEAEADTCLRARPSENAGFSRLESAERGLCLSTPEGEW